MSGKIPIPSSLRRNARQAEPGRRTHEWTMRGRVRGEPAMKCVCGTTWLASGLEPLNKRTRKAA
jgi:hypothetical protein